MMYMLWVVLGISMAVVVFSLIMGLANAHRPLMSQKMMRIRVVSQAFSLIVFAILLIYGKSFR